MDYNTDSDHERNLNELNDPSPNSLANFSSQIVLNDDDMTRKRHLYETAFDCSVTKQDNDVDQLDKVSNHPLLVQLTNSKAVHASAGSSTDCDTQNCKVSTVYFYYLNVTILWALKVTSKETTSI